MNEDTLKGQWTQLKGAVREQWGKLTNMISIRFRAKANSSSVRSSSATIARDGPNPAVRSSNCGPGPTPAPDRAFCEELNVRSAPSAHVGPVSEGCVPRQDRRR